MKKGRTASRQPYLTSLHTACERLTWFVLIAGAVCIPLVVVPSAYDPFRAPKELLLIGEGITLAGLSVARAALRRDQQSRVAFPPGLRLLVLAIVVWCAVITLTSSNRIVSFRSLLVAATALMVFVTAYDLGRSHSEVTLLVVLVPAVINGIIAIGQRAGIWTIFHIQIPLSGRSRTLALLGNPDDVGVYLLLPGIAALAFAISSRRYRLVAAAAAAVTLGGLFASETISAIVAVVAGVTTLALLLSRAARVGVLLSLAVMIAAFPFILPERWRQLREAAAVAATGDFDPLLSTRTPAFVAAWRMFRRHPLIGVGLGCFHVHYFDEKIAAEEQFPSFLNLHAENFGEAHNEHLQLLAEGGVPAYALFVTALVLLARRSFAGSVATDARSVIARRLALPAATTVAVVSLAQFPLRLAAPTLTMSMILALTMAGSEPVHD